MISVYWIPGQLCLYPNGFIPGSISIGLDGRFAEWAGSLFPFDNPLLLVTETRQGKGKYYTTSKSGS